MDLVFILYTFIHLVKICLANVNMYNYKQVAKTTLQDHSGSLLGTQYRRSRLQCSTTCDSLQCVAFSYDSQIRECRTYSGEICYREDGITPATVNVYVKELGDCPADWLKFEGKCYYFSNTEKIWNDALNDCEERCASLARIESASINAFVQSEMTTTGTSHYFFAANDKDVEGEWRWGTSGEAVGYTAWDNGQPSTYGGGIAEHCAAIFANGKWHDTPCGQDPMTYICERLVEGACVLGEFPHIQYAIDMPSQVQGQENVDTITLNCITPPLTG